MILALISIFIISLPILFSLFLGLKRLSHSYIDKKIANNGLVVVNLMILGFFSLFKIFNKQIHFVFVIDKTNIYFLIYCALAYLILSIILKKFFKAKKQFIFTKTRFYAFLSLLISNTYLFFISTNLIQNLIFWILSGIIIYIFSYFDIYKSRANYNLNRFYRILSLGDFCYLTFIFILFKYCYLTNGEVMPLALNFSNLDVTLNYVYGVCEPYELVISLVCFITAIFSRLLIFPFNCFYSFISSSSNPLFLSVFCCCNYSFAAFLLYKILPYFNLLNEYKLYLAIFLAVSCLITAVLLLFEKSFKIIFGYIFSIINSLFLISLFKFNYKIAFEIYFSLALIIFLVLSCLFLSDRTTFQRRLINKYNGFILEKIHIFVFEKFLNSLLIPMFIVLLGILAAVFYNDYDYLIMNPASYIVIFGGFILALNFLNIINSRD